MKTVEVLVCHTHGLLFEQNSTKMRAITLNALV